MPLVSVRFDIRGAGPLHDPPEHPGLAIMTAVMLRHGTADRSSRDIAEQLDLLGAAISAGTSGDPATIFLIATGLPDTFDQWFPLVADLVVKPSFPGDELNIAKRGFASEMAARRSTSTAAASDLMVSVMISSAAPIIASPQQIQQLPADRLVSWHRERYVPQNTVLSIAGDVDADSVERTVRSTLASWARTGFTDTPPAFRALSGRVVHVMDRPGSVQTALMLAGTAPTRADADYPAMFVGTVTLGAVQSGRLVRALREARGWSYNGQAGLLTYKHGGLWLAYGDVSTARTGDALTVFLDELRRLTTEPVTAPELEDAKRSVIGGFALNLESLAAVAANMAVRRIEGLSADYWQRFPDIIHALSAEDVRRVAAKYMDPSKSQIVAVGERDQVVPLLTPFGPITFYDSEGRPLK